MEFRAAIQQLDNSISLDDINLLFRGFDKNGNGFIDFEEFCAVMQGDLSNARRALVERAFWTIDKMGLGQVQVEEMFG